MTSATVSTATADAPEPSMVQIDQLEIGKMTPHELRMLCEGLHTVIEVISGVLNQPRFMDSKTRCYNRSAEYLDRIYEGLCGVREAAWRAAKESNPTDPRNVEHKAWCVIGVLADHADGLAELNIEVAHALKEIEHAKFDAAHAARKAAA